MMNIQYKLTVSNFAKLDEIIMKQVQHFLGSSLMNFDMGKSYRSHKYIQRNIYDKTSKKSTAHGKSENFVLYYQSPLSHVCDFGLE